MRQSDIKLGKLYQLKSGTVICADSHNGVEWIGYLDEHYGSKKLAHVSDIEKEVHDGEDN